MKLKISKSYLTKYLNPIILNKRDKVILGRKEQKPVWDGWIWAESDNNAGQIPVQLVSTNDGINGIILDNYTAKELDVTEGDTVILIKELNGWYWVRHLITNEEGWIPKENTTII